MAQNGYGPAPVAGHVGRIPNFGKSQPMGHVEPPACIQNAMMTKDKKPFTYTPGGLDLSQIRTPSMARRMARQRSLEEQDQQQQSIGSNYRPQGGPVPPPPPPPQMPGPPPPPPLVIDVPKAKSPKPVQGERPEIVIPDNPIGMLRKTNSPYHWEAEKAEMDRLGPVPKFMEKVPSPLTVKMPPSNFSQQPPQTYIQQGQHPFTPQNYPFKTQNNQPESPIHKPEAQYVHQKSNSPKVVSATPTREILQRQDSQFNKSPQPFTGQSPLSNGSTFSPTPNNNWKQPERRDSPLGNNSSMTPQGNRGLFSPNTQQFSPNYQDSPVGNSDTGFHTLPRANQRNQDSYVNNLQRNNNNVIYNNVRDSTPPNSKGDSNPTPWRTNTLNRHPREVQNQQPDYQNSKSDCQQSYSPPWKTNDSTNKQIENTHIPSWKQNNTQDGNKFANQNQQQYSPPWVRSPQDSNNNKVQESYSPSWKSQDVPNTTTNNSESSFGQHQTQQQPRYQSTMSIPVTPRTPNLQQEYNNPSNQKEVVYVNQEPIYFCPGSPKSVPPFVKTQKEKTKTPPPAWCQRPLDGRKSLPRELETPPREKNQEPEWIRKSNEMQKGAREVVSPPKQQQLVQPAWSTRPSDNRRIDNTSNPQGNRMIPIHMEVLQNKDQNRMGDGQQPQLRLVIDMQSPNNQTSYSQPTQRIMRVLSPQLVRLDDGTSQPDLPSLNRNIQAQDNQPKTRIIPIQIEGGDNSGANKSVYYHKFTQEGPPRQSKAFKVLQIITGTQDLDEVQHIEDQHGFSDV